MTLLSNIKVRPETTGFLAWLVAVVLGLNLLVVGYTAMTMERARRAAELHAEKWTQNLALAMEKELEGIIKTSDMILHSVIDEIRRQGDGGIIDTAALNAHIEPLQSRFPYTDGVSLIDAHGLVRYGSDVAPGTLIDVSDREYFKALLDQHDDALVISKPLISRVSKKWVVVFARRINARDGSFDGIALTPVPVENLTRTFAQIALPEGASISLRSFTLETIARYEAGGQAKVPPVQSNAGPEIIRMLSRGATEGTVHDVTPRDGVRRIRSFRKVGHYPLYLIVGRAEDEYLAEWRRSRTLELVTLSVFLVLTMSLSVLVFRYARSLARARDKMQRMAHTDFLTGLANRRAFIEAAELELARATRYGTPLSLLMLDIDFFKKINDARGHEAGDAALKRLAACALGVLREVDVMGRWGGEEFVILLPETDAHSAAEVAERLRAAVEKSESPGGDGSAKLTVSIGYTALTGSDEGIDALVRNADAALYRAKNSGRNRVCEWKTPDS